MRSVVEGIHLAKPRPRHINMIVGCEGREGGGMQHISRAITAEQIPVQIQFNPFSGRTGFSREGENADPIVGDFNVYFWPIGSRFQTRGK